jgi:hypothetical protein
MFAIGTKAWMLAAGVSHVTGVPVGMTASGTGIGGMAIEHEIIAPVLTRGGTVAACTPGARQLQTNGVACAGRPG